MRVGRDYAYWVSYSWTYEWLDPFCSEWVSDRDSESERFYCNKKDIKKEAEKKAIESMDGLQYRNLKVTINDSYRTTTEEI